MRTTLNLDPALLARFKEIAARSGRTLTAVLEDSLRESLERRDRPRKRTKVSLPTYGRGGVRPGVDLDHTASLMELLDEDDAAPGR